MDIELSVERDETSLDVEAFWRGSRVGYAWCTISGGRLHIGDLNVDDEHPIPWPIFHVFFIRMGFKARRRSFRNKGIGTLLLNRVLAEADAMGIEEVWGSVTEDDATQSPFLLPWYERHGFAVTHPDSDCINTAFRKITRRKAVGSPGSH